MGTLAELAAARSLAAGAGRADLVERLDRAAERLRSAADVTVAVVGEFKQGKSTLINALLRTDVCPADADLVTALPTVLRHGTTPTAYLRVPGEPDVEIEFGQARALITAQAGALITAAGEPGPEAVEIRLDRRLLGAGLSLIDTPGVGGLDSAQGNLTLATLPLAAAALFVTGAAQELTAPEVDFLRRVAERCPRVALVLTKTDLYPEWRRIVELDQAHLRRAGLDVPVVPVSSFLRLRAHARNSTELNAESGFPRLVELLRRDVLDAAEADRAAAARAELGLVVADLQARLDAEHTAATTPERASEVARRYAEVSRRAAALGGGSWQTVLGDGIQDLAADVDHDLRERLRLLLRRGEDLLDESDPGQTWPDFQAWAAREAASAAADNLQLLVVRSEQLAREVADRFQLEYAGLAVDLPAPELALRKVDQLEVSFQKSGVHQFLGAFTAARVAYGGFVMLGAVGALFNVALAAPIALVAGLTLGRRMIKGERERQVRQRRAQAKAELRRYVDDVGFHAGRDCREAVRRTQRYLRDEFAARAHAVERSAAATAASVREIASLPAAERRSRVEALAGQRRAVAGLVS